LIKTPTGAGVVAAEALRPFNFTLPTGEIITGKIQDRVIRERNGYLDFYFRIITDMPVQANTLDVIRSNYEGDDGTVGSLVDVNYRLDKAGTAAPDMAQRSMDGATILFHFDNAVIGSTPTDSSGTRFTFIQTHATKFDVGGQFQTSWNGFSAFTIRAFRPYMGVNP
jgi:hypothetical protein